MIKVHDSKDITLEICQEIRKLAKVEFPCKGSYVPFVKALRKKDLEECVAIINGEIQWLNYYEILPKKFILNGRTVKYYSFGQKLFEGTYEDNKLHGKYEQWNTNGGKNLECTYVNGELQGNYETWFKLVKSMKNVLM